MARIGLMLWTVRGECAGAFEPTLREVAEMGYEGVELFDLHGHEPDEVASWLADTGPRRLRPPRLARGDRGAIWLPWRRRPARSAGSGWPSAGSILPSSARILSAA